jgi:hypothetical protein
MASEEFVGRLNGEDVYRLPPRGILVEYRCGEDKYRSLLTHHEKYVVMELPSFDEIPLGEFQSWISKLTQELRGAQLHMERPVLRDDGTIESQPLKICGWSSKMTVEERDFLDSITQI